jgi:hypothetical protein
VIAEWLEKDPSVTAAVIEQRLRPLGYDGGHSTLRELAGQLRPQLTQKRAFVRMEPPPGERFEVDWGHFGAPQYAGDSANSMPSPWSKRTAAWCMSSLRTVKVSKRSRVVTYMRSTRSVG